METSRRACGGPPPAEGWRGRLLVVMLAPLLFGGSCAPTPYEAGAAVLIATPVAMMVGLGFVLALSALWRPVRPAIEVPIRAYLGVAGAALLSGLIAWLARSDQDIGRWVGVAILTFGSTFVTALLIAWRVSLAFGPASAAKRALVAATLLVVAPAVLLLVGAPIEGVVVGWLYGGIYGVPPLAILIGLLVEIAIRRSRDRSVPTR